MIPNKSFQPVARYALWVNAAIKFRHYAHLTKQQWNFKISIRNILLLFILLFSNTVTAENIEIRKFAQNEYPNDYTMQEYVYNEQLLAYKYMNRVSDKIVKKIAISEYPNDFLMQKYIYGEQLQAKKYMQLVSNVEIKEFSIYEYPNDFSMQEYVYNEQLSAYKYMNRVSDKIVKKIAISEYPNDFSMQKYIYDEQIATKNRIQ